MSNQYRTNLDYIIEIVAFILIVGGLALGVQLNYWFFLVPALIFVLLYQKKKREKIIKLQKEVIKNQWGKGPKVKAGLEYRDFLHWQRIIVHLILDYLHLLELQIVL
ncbi:MAG: hypothetical protein GX968_00555 [Tissierellia bacterium]|nr:hypothetical protein [Tissierellia bacterium]